MDTQFGFIFHLDSINTQILLMLSDWIYYQVKTVHIVTVTIFWGMTVNILFVVFILFFLLVIPFSFY